MYWDQSFSSPLIVYSFLLRVHSPQLYTKDTKWNRYDIDGNNWRKQFPRLSPYLLNSSKRIGLFFIEEETKRGPPVFSAIQCAWRHAWWMDSPQVDQIRAELFVEYQSQQIKLHGLAFLAGLTSSSPRMLLSDVFLYKLSSVFHST